MAQTAAISPVVQEATSTSVGLALGVPCSSQLDDALEDNDDCATATPVNNGGIPNLFVSKTDKDHYSFCVAAGRTVFANLVFTTADGDIDCFLRTASAVECGTGNGANELAEGFSNTDSEFVSWTNNTGSDQDVILEVNVWDDASNNDCNSYDLFINSAGFCGGDDAGVRFCGPVNPNSTGSPTVLVAFYGSGIETGVHLEARDGVPGEIGYFLAGSRVDFVGVPISNGRLCLDTDPSQRIGRYNYGAEKNSTGMFDSNGLFQNLSGTATSSSGTGFDIPMSLPDGAMIWVGESWHFQLWHRDTVLGSNVSNFSNGLSIFFF